MSSGEWPGKLNEQRLIERIARAVPSLRAVGWGRAAENESGLSAVLGIGDDAAVIPARAGAGWAVSCDSFIEGTHFLPGTPAEAIGYKALARAASDLAAMGVQPRFFLLGLALPLEDGGRWLGRFLRGMSRAARLLGMKLIGGDTTSGRLGVHITVLGECRAGRAITRSGARPGDAIYVSGALGGAQLGLEALRRGTVPAALRPFVSRHLYPRIPAELGAWLGRRRVASSMIDISDGLSTDLGRLCKASGAGARIWAERVPSPALPADMARPGRGLRINPLRLALHGGDDYELLFTVPGKRQAELEHAPGFEGIVQIGEITQDSKVLLLEAGGRIRTLRPEGWDPFRRC